MNPARILYNSLIGLLKLVRDFTVGIFTSMKQDSVNILELQYLELENAFLSLVMGGMVGLHMIPIGLSMELAPLLKDEISIMEKRHFLGSDVLADYFAELGGEW